MFVLDIFALYKYNTLQTLVKDVQAGLLIQNLTLVSIEISMLLNIVIVKFFKISHTFLIAQSKYYQYT